MQSRIVKVFLSLASCFLLFSCSKAKTESTKSSGVPNHHVIITYLTTGDKPSNNGTSIMLEKLNARLNELANAELEIYYIPWNNYQTNYNLKLAENDGSIDLIGTATDWLDAWKNVNLGNFMPLTDEMIQTYAPKTWASVSEDHWNVCRVNGYIYLFPEDNFTQWTNHGFMYRKDWAKEAGLPNGVHSWEDLTKYMSYAKKNKNVIPWDSNGSSSTYHPEGYIQSKSDFVIADGITSTNMFGTKKSNLKIIYSPFIEGNELVEYAKLMRQWNNDGFWPKNVLTANADGRDNRDEFCNGLTAVEQHHTQTWYTQVYKKLLTNQGAESGFFWFGEESGNVVYQTITHGAMAISASSKHPERALMVYDLLRNDEECYNLMNYGIEGVQFSRNADGYREKIKGSHGITTNYWWGRNDALEVRDTATAWDVFDDINATYGKYKIDYPFSQIVWDLTNISNEVDAVADVYGSYMGNICYGQVADPVAYVAEFRQELKKAGIDKIISELQKQLDSYYANKR